MALNSIVNELKDAMVATLKGTSDVLTALREGVKTQVTGGTKDVADVVTAGLLSAKEVGVTLLDSTKDVVWTAVMAVFYKRGGGIATGWVEGFRVLVRGPRTRV